MTMTHQDMETRAKSLPITGVIWIMVLIGSILPEIALSTIIGTIPAWLPWVKILFFGALLLLSVPFKQLRAAAAFGALLLVMTTTTFLLNGQSLNIAVVQTALGDSEFIRTVQPNQTQKLIVTVLVMILLLMLGYRRKDLYLTWGNLRAAIQPVRLLGFPKPDSWVSFGGQWSVYLALGTAAGLWLTSQVPLPEIDAFLPFLPVVLLMAALNAFNEEFIYRSSVIATLENHLHRKQIWWISAAFFGIAHFWGMPSGFVGVLLATFMGWILAKAMLETRGFFWSWWIHFFQDIVIFSFLVSAQLG